MTSKNDLLWLLNLRLKIVRFINQTFLSLSENTQHELLEEVKVYLCYGFRGLSPWSLGSAFLNVCEAELPRLWEHVEEEDAHIIAERKSCRGPGETFKGLSQLTSFFKQVVLPKVCRTPQVKTKCSTFQVMGASQIQTTTRGVCEQFPYFISFNHRTSLAMHTVILLS